VISKLAIADTSAVDFTVEAFLTNNKNNPVIKGINRMISNIIASDYQDENNE
jgi:hypothetical protein